LYLYFTIDQMGKNRIIDINEYYTDLSYEVTSQIPYCVCPFHELRNNIPYHYGSGVLIKIDKSFFLATASHNLEDSIQLSVPVPPDLFIPIEGKSYRTVGASDIYKDDRIDVAVIKLKSRTVDYLLKHYKFLDGSHIAINHEIAINMAYIMIGYPKGKTDRNPKEKITVCNPFTYHTESKPIQYYQKLGYDNRFNILVEYDINNLHTKKINEKNPGPHPKGMSGGALFHVPYQTIDSDKEPIMFYLVGILQYFFLQDKKTIVATKIDFITEFIREKFNINIPKSSKINANMITKT
jgi:hypothetical protein